MAIFSKYHLIQNVGKTCADYTHPGITCEHFAFTTFRDASLGGLQYYLPSTVIPALLKYDKWSIPFWTKVFKDYFQSTLFGASIMILVGYGSFCCFYESIRRHHKVFVFLPCMLGSLFGYFLPPHILELQSIGAVNMAMDFELRYSRSPLVQWLRRSKVVNTLLFMGSSGMIAYVLNQGLIRRYWFLNIQPRTASTGNHEMIEKDGSSWMNKILKREFKICTHSQTCDQHILSEMRRTAVFSFFFALANFLASQSKSLKGNWHKFPLIFGKNFDYALFFFLTSYSGAYRFLNCLLNRQTNEDSIRNSAIAATLSGATYLLSGKYLILAFAFIRAVQLFGMDLVARKKDQNEFYRKVDRIPFNWILYTLATAYAYQARVFYPAVCPKYVHQLMTIGTGRRSDTLTENYAAILMGLK